MNDDVLLCFPVKDFEDLQNFRTGQSGCMENWEKRKTNSSVTSAHGWYRWGD